MNNILQNGLASFPSDITDGLGRYLGGVMLEALPSMLLYGLLGFTLAVALCIYIRRQGLLSRKRRPWNILAKLSYVAMLAALSAGGAVYGALSYLHDELGEGLSGAVEPAIKAQMPLVRTYLTAQVASYGPDHVVTVKELVAPLIKQLYYVPKSDGMWERGKAGAVNGVVLNYGAAALAEALQKTLVGKIETFSASTRLDVREQERGELANLGTSIVTRLTTDRTRQLDLRALDKTLPQMLVRLMRQHLDAQYSALCATLVGALVMLGMLIGGEMLLYFRWYLPRRRRDSVGRVSAA